ncbi:glycosyltransferase family 2 protein [Tropicibacter sp. S64]|uniref:glycosyltransferase family 2 protein n=1 Tax=Tropicibacter sp. S64 TaxID=3415122 RepID=UPI003C7B0858
MPRFLILCPTFNHADALFMSTASVRAQEEQDWEMVIIGDGAPPRTDRIVAEICAQDRRITYRPHPKGPRYGETYRDAVIRESGADIVCHLSDDDLWAPNHLTVMGRLLEQADWGCQAALRLMADGRFLWMPVNQGLPAMRAQTAAGVAVSTGINYVAYRRAAYLALPEGWTDAPWEAGPSDQFMWAKFMRRDGLRIASTAGSSALKLPSHTPERFAATPEYRATELGPWLARIGAPGLLDALRRESPVQVRLARLMALCHAGRAETFAGALAACGMVEAESVDVALDGAPMALPLTVEQRQETTRAWLCLRVLVEQALPFSALLEGMGPEMAAWNRALHLLAQEQPEAAQQGAERLAAHRPALEVRALALRLTLFARAGEGEAAAALLASLPEAKREHPDIRRAAAMMTKLADERAGAQPWLSPPPDRLARMRKLFHRFGMFSKRY